MNLLKDEFLDIPARHIENTLRDKNSLFDTFIALENQLRSYSRTSSPFTKITKPRLKRGFEDILADNMTCAELQAAKRKSQHEAGK